MGMTETFGQVIKEEHLQTITSYFMKRKCIRVIWDSCSAAIIQEDASLIWQLQKTNWALTTLTNCSGAGPIGKIVTPLSTVSLSKFKLLESSKSIMGLMTTSSLQHKKVTIFSPKRYKIQVQSKVQILVNYIHLSLKKQFVA